MTTHKIFWTPSTKEPKINHALATSSAFNLKLCHKRPGSLPLSGAAPLYDGFVGGLNVGQFNNGQLKRVILELLDLKCRFLSLVRLKRWLVGG